MGTPVIDVEIGFKYRIKPCPVDFQVTAVPPRESVRVGSPPLSPVRVGMETVAHAAIECAEGVLAEDHEAGSGTVIPAVEAHCGYIVVIEVQRSPGVYPHGVGELAVAARHSCHEHRTVPCGSQAPFLLGQPVGYHPLVPLREVGRNEEQAVGVAAHYASSVPVLGAEEEPAAVGTEVPVAASVTGGRKAVQTGVGRVEVVIFLIAVEVRAEVYMSVRLDAEVADGRGLRLQYALQLTVFESVYAKAAFAQSAYIYIPFEAAALDYLQAVGCVGNLFGLAYAFVQQSQGAASVFLAYGNEQAAVWAGCRVEEHTGAAELTGASAAYVVAENH